MGVYDIHNPTRTMRIIHDGILNSNKMVRIAPGETKRNVRLGEPTIKLIQGRQNHLRLFLVSDGGFPDPLPPPPPQQRPRPEPRQRPTIVPQTAAPHVPVRHAAPDEVAVVIGGAEGVWDEWAKAKELCDEAGARAITFVINDSIPLFLDHVDHVVTLHPDKYEREWAPARAAAGLAAPGIIWSHRRHRAIQKDTPDWGGSSGLFAIKIAMELGFNKILLCGVPMTIEGKHVVRKEPWRACDQFRKAWERHRRELTKCVRSFSGWTATNFGPPSVAFIANGLPDRIGPDVQAGRVAELIN